MAGLDWLNSAPFPEVEAELFRCCGCAGWARAVVVARPFATGAALISRAESEWSKASREDILEAFSHHPRIGDRDAPRAAPSGTGEWSAAEQSGVDTADQSTLAALSAANDEYEARFGYIFVVCASGKTAAEMLGLLRARLPNEDGVELRIAAGEQMKITLLRIDRLLHEKGASAAGPAR